MIQVRDLLDHLKTYPPETRLRLLVSCTDGSTAAGDDYQMRRGEDGVTELCVCGALVKQMVAKDGE